MTARVIMMTTSGGAGMNDTVWKPVVDAAYQGAVLVVIAAIGLVVFWFQAQFAKIRSRIGKNEVKTDKNTEHLGIQRQGDLARAEILLRKSDATLNEPGDDNPILLTAKVRRLYAPITAELHRMYLQSRSASIYDSTDLSWQIEKRFLQFLTGPGGVCHQINFDRRECIAAAMAIAREGKAAADPNGSVGEVG
jgi:hypothetical protein